MTQAKHTPGPWTQGWSKSGIDCVWLDGKTEPEIGMGYDADWIDCATEANARLISAAPDLFDSHEPEREGPDFLDWVADRLVHQHGESANADFILCLRRRAEKARAAIAKATGS